MYDVICIIDDEFKPTLHDTLELIYQKNGGAISYIEQNRNFNSAIRVICETLKRKLAKDKDYKVAIPIISSRISNQTFEIIIWFARWVKAQGIYLGNIHFLIFGDSMRDSTTRDSTMRDSTMRDSIQIDIFSPERIKYHNGIENLLKLILI